MAQNTSNQINHHKVFIQESLATFNAEISSHPPSSSPKDFLITIKSFMISLNSYFSKYHQPMSFIEDTLHLIWQMVISVAKITPSEDPAQNELVLQLLYFRELGTLRRAKNGTEEEALVFTLKGERRIWTDLPFFAEDLLAEWKKNASMTKSQQLNLTAFTGRCVASGVGGDDVALCVLWLLREVLETDRMHEHQPGKSDDDERGLPIVDLLSVCTVLLEQCCHKILLLCLNGPNLANEDSLVSMPGELAANGGVEQPGFSMKRWLFWRHRARELSSHDDGLAAKKGKTVFDIMIGCGREIGFVVEGEERYWERVEKLLVEELKSSGKQSVGLEDIVTDPAWAD